MPGASTYTPAPAPAPPPKTGFRIHPGTYIVWGARIIVLILSVLLIIFISYDTLRGEDFLQIRSYMNFQFWVCVAFLADFAVEFFFSADKGAYLQRHWVFLVVAVPYLNIINLLHISVAHQTLYFIRFIPLVRGAYAMAYVVAFCSSNKALSLLSQYIVVMVAAIYFVALIFYQQETGINPEVTSFWDAIYWACLDATTVGSEITPVTVAGRVCAIVISVMGVMTFPVFTVFITTYITHLRNKSVISRLQSQIDRISSGHPETPIPGQDTEKR